LTAKGQYTGVKSLVSYLEQIHKLAPAKQMEVLGDLFGQHATKASIIGAGGFEQLVKDMERQASLQQRINNSLGTLTNLWDAATGSFQNVLAAFASSYAPELKELATSLNSIASKAFDWVNANKAMINTAIKMAAVFVGVKLAFYAVGVALVFVSRLMQMNSFGVFLQAVALAAPLIIANWDTITKAFKSSWEYSVNWVSDKIMSIVSVVEAVSAAIIHPIETMKNLFAGLASVISGSFSGFNLPSSANSMSLPGQSIQRKPIVSNHGFKGSLDINHVNAPAGFRASPVQSKGPVRVNQNVGYNFMVTGH
jgi:hypothetical protein